MSSKKWSKMVARNQGKIGFENVGNKWKILSSLNNVKKTI